MLAVTFGILSAVLFSAQIVLTGRAVLSASPKAVLWAQTTIVLITILGWIGIQGGTWPDIETTGILFAAGIMAPLLARALYVYSLSRLGSNLTTPIVLSHPLVTVVLATLLLGERLNASGYGAAACILAGGFVVAVGGRKGTGNRSKSTLGESLRQLFPAMVAAIAYGTSLILRKRGLSAGASPQMAALITSVPAWVVYTTWFLVTRNKEVLRPALFRSKPLIASGLFGGAAMMLWYLSISAAPISLIAPLGATAPVFALLLNFLFFRSENLINTAIVLGTIISAVGVAIIAFQASGRL